MPIYLWKKQNAVLITKAARYVVPIIIAAAGTAGGYIMGLIRGKKTKKQKE